MMRRFLFFPVLVLMFIGSIFANADHEYLVDAHTMALWHLNEGSGIKVTDATGNSEDGELDPDAIWVDGKFGGALDTTKGGVTVSDNECFRLQEITVEAWIYKMTTSGWAVIVSKDHKTNPPDGSYRLQLDQPGILPHIRFRIDGAWDPFSGNTVIPTDTWTHIAATYDGKEVKLYINGQEEASRSVSGEIWYDDSPLFIGRYANFGNAQFGGIIDEVRISDVARRPGELGPNYTAVEVKDKLVMTWAGIKNGY